MDTPDRELDLLCIKRSLSGKNMLIDAVDQRAIEVEQKGDAAKRPLVDSRAYSEGRYYANTPDECDRLAQRHYL
jgi:hypothetical protein